MWRRGDLRKHRDAAVQKQCDQSGATRRRSHSSSSLSHIARARKPCLLPSVVRRVVPPHLVEGLLAVESAQRVPKRRLLSGTAEPHAHARTNAHTPPLESDVSPTVLGTTMHPMRGCELGLTRANAFAAALYKGCRRCPRSTTCCNAGQHVATPDKRRLLELPQRQMIGGITKLSAMRPTPLKYVAKHGTTRCNTI